MGERVSRDIDFGLEGRRLRRPLEIGPLQVLVKASIAVIDLFRGQDTSKGCSFVAFFGQLIHEPLLVFSGSLVAKSCKQARSATGSFTGIRFNPRPHGLG